MTCFQKRAWADAQRQTWVRDILSKGYADIKFFIGASDCHWRSFSNQRDDEVWLEDVPDDYRGIPLKVKAICRYARQHGYERVSKCDDDVYVIPERFATLPIAPADYVGRFRSPCGTVFPAHFASGFFYTLSERAAGIVADTPWNRDWMDERFVATALARQGIIGYSDCVNYMVTGPRLPGHQIVGSDDFRKGTVFCEYGPTDMHAMHLAMRHLSPIREYHPGLLRMPQVVVTDEILSSKPNDDVPPHKRKRVYGSN